MFWKKKSDEAITIELASDDRRNSVRIQPLDEIIIHHDTQQFKLIDISFTGLAFEMSSGLFKKEDSFEITLSLPLGSTGILSEKKVTISNLIKVVQINGEICHCRFIKQTHQNKLLIDRFILNEQKRQILSQINSE